ncbi:hypothetical protein [Arenimonas sp.]|uniref:hypothetical protein n=1 Tax=Arenimonas sp. TaxID=1872635 RepID=UPI002E36A409|nr:hypothetical protein [Arenimonas sp.]HEX4854369.1 hypothetical protein [Arenimonas sp.]
MIRTALILSALVAAPAFAADSVATLSAQQGTVLVNQGDEFVTATDAQALLAGDRVMVMEGGSAEITFTDGCVLPLASGSLVDVPEVSTCAGAVAKVQNLGPSYAQAVGSRASARNAAAPYVFGAWGVVIAAMIVEGDTKFTYGEPAASP